MPPKPSSVRIAMSQIWWVLALRGATTLAFGALALVWPSVTLLVLTALFAAYALIGGAGMVAGAAANGTPERGWWLLLPGGVSLFIGAVALYRPDTTLYALLTLMAVHAFATAAADIALGLRLRRERAYEWLLFAAGVLSIGFGVLIVAYPPAGALSLALLVSCYATATGASLLVCSFGALRGQQHAHVAGEYRDAPVHPRGT